MARGSHVYSSHEIDRYVSATLGDGMYMVNLQHYFGWALTAVLTGKAVTREYLKPEGFTDCHSASNFQGESTVRGEKERRSRLWWQRPR